MTTSTPEGPLAQPPQWHARPVPFRVEPLRRWLHAAWDEFVSRHSGGWMWHLTGWIEYQRAYARGAGEDHSFAVLDESHRIVAVAPMFVFRPPGKTPELSYAGDPLPLPLLRDAGAARIVEEEIGRIAREAGACLYRAAGHPFRSASSASADLFLPLRSTGAAAQRVVESASWKDIRDSYRSLIHGGERQYVISSHRGLGASAAFSAYERLHRRLHGGRLDATYRLQREWLLDGRALVMLAEASSAAWGAAYWFVYKRRAYYGSGAYLARNISHAVVWHALQALQAFGVEQASLGWQGVARTEKERGIEWFKTGFGGHDVPVNIVEMTFGAEGAR